MNSRQYEQMRLAEQAEKPKKVASHATLLRHLKRKSEVDLANAYFDYGFENIKELKSMVKSMGWTWKEAQNCKHRDLNYFLNPAVSVYLDNDQRTKYKNMFKKDVPFLFWRDHVEEVYWYPTLDDMVDFVEKSAILLQDPDHVGLSGVYFKKLKHTDDNGKEFDYYLVTFSLDS